MSSATSLPSRNLFAGLVHESVAGLSHPLHLLLLQPASLYLLCLTAMLFRPPDLAFCCVDRIAFGLLIFFVLLRSLALRQPVALFGSATWPMLGLLGLAFADLAFQPFEPEAWSVFAAKWAVPFVLYHIAGNIFPDAASLRKLETFVLIVLGYLILIALLFLFDAKAFIFPSFIVDDNIGIHADRARGPFLQAVANGVALNLLGLLALNAYRRRRLHWQIGLLFLITLPMAVLATKTRAVWLSFAISTLISFCWSLSPRVHRACLCLTLIGGLGLAAAFICKDRDASFTDRLEERSPVDFRMAMYQAGWEMFLQKPFSGWGFDGMQMELARHISRFHQREYFFHNTFLEIAVQYGAVGLALYIWIIVKLFRLKRPPPLALSQASFLDEGFRELWPVLLLVYLLNASFVVMNYQFVNGFLFTLAGILAAQNRGVKQLHAVYN